ncbi:GNAT family N-acetyltransferase [Weissella viridescens]|uniref:GNAT family N-acetyltransferase n=1 Tax=Weissella viridescens TaxID=1629 RepID=A0A3P2RL73_WEIVI|nr:GNAT family N-acetyltransferase [Weissella viridescens]RRG18412.1 GNAT family N-acetyltransferase [Weissella viridescens]
MSNRFNILCRRGFSDVQIDAFNIRQTVFVTEQNIDASDEFDSFDESALHLVGYLDAIPVTTVRLVVTDYVVNIQRVATLASYRGQHFATQLLQYVLSAFDQQDDIRQFELDAQCSAQSFYEKLGFTPVGHPFEEVGIPHIHMLKLKQ